MSRTSYGRGSHGPPRPSYTKRARGHHDDAPRRQGRMRNRPRDRRGQVDRLAQLVRALLPRVDGAEALLRAPTRVLQARDTGRRVRARAGRGQVPERAVVARADRGQARARAGRQPRERHDRLPRHTVGALRCAHRRPKGGQEAAPSREAPQGTVGAARQDQGLARDIRAPRGRRRPLRARALGGRHGRRQGRRGLPGLATSFWTISGGPSLLF